MTEENKEQASRIKVDDLAEKETELTAEEAKSVKGGGALSQYSNAAFKQKMGDGSVKPQDAVSNQITVKQES